MCVQINCFIFVWEHKIFFLLVAVGEVSMKEMVITWMTVCVWDLIFREELTVKREKKVIEFMVAQDMIAGSA